jgi:hypothetical protein
MYWLNIFFFLKKKDGITYERQSILDHFSRNGNVDPITGRPCTESQLIPNLSLREAIEDFLKDNGWAAGNVLMVFKMLSY